MRSVNILFLLLLMIFSEPLSAQEKSVIDLFKSDANKANTHFRRKEYNKASEYYVRLSKKDSSNSFFKLRLAECYMYLNNTEESERYFRQVIHKNTAIDPIHTLHYAEVLMSNGKTDSARYWFEKYNQNNLEDKRSQRMMVQAGAIHKLLKDSLAYTVSTVGFNSSEADFGTVYYKKGIVFLSSRKSPAMVRNIKSSDNTYFLDLYYIEPSGDTSFTKPVEFHTDLNFSLHDGPVTFFDGGKKAVLGRNLKGAGEKKLGLYYGEYQEKGDKWINIQELPFCSKSYNVSHPFYHSPSNSLYFISDMPGGYGGSDIYISHFKDGKWSHPKNLGTVINTEKNETFPFVTSDSVLYFSSDGHGGLGGHDVFSADLKEKHYAVKNLGYPVNSFKDDFAFVLNEKGTEGFFSSNRKHGGYDDDIYRVKVNRIQVEGIVVDKLKSVGIKDARVALVSKETEEKELLMTTNSKGNFAFSIIPGREYRIEIHADSYRPEALEVSSSDPDQKLLRVKGLMEKYSKTYVKGMVMLNGEPAGISRVQIFDPTADTVEVLQTNARGEFQCQVNTDTSSILLAEGNGKLGIYVAVPVKRKRKATSIQFIEVSLGTLDSIKVKGVYTLKESGQPDPDAQLILRNEQTNKEDQISFNEKGEFSLKLWDVGLYSIFVERNGERKLLKKSFEPWKSKSFVLTEE